MARGNMKKLKDLYSVGPQTIKDLEQLEIYSLDTLKEADPDNLFRQLCEITNSNQDPCVLDVFRCAVAQARNPKLPKEQKKWWYWSKIRKEGLSFE